MKKHRYVCVKCGKGFHAYADEILTRNLAIFPIDRRQCGIAFFGKDWRPSMWKRGQRKTPAR